MGNVILANEKHACNHWPCKSGRTIIYHHARVLSLEIWRGQAEEILKMVIFKYMGFVGISDPDTSTRLY